jgi:hypothetical protein
MAAPQQDSNLIRRYRELWIRTVPPIRGHHLRTAQRGLSDPAEESRGSGVGVQVWLVEIDGFEHGGASAIEADQVVQRLASGVDRGL